MSWQVVVIIAVSVFAALVVVGWAVAVWLLSPIRFILGKGKR